MDLGPLHLRHARPRRSAGGILGRVLHGRDGDVAEAREVPT
jgi:hypothetical protein